MQSKGLIGYFRFYILNFILQILDLKLKILTYDEINREEWSALVRGSATGTWFQSCAAYEFFVSMPNLFQPFVVGLENEGKLRAVCVGYVTKEKSAIKQFFTRRAIIIGGPAFADDCSDDEAYALMQAVRLQFKISSFKFQIFDAPIYIETRNFNDYSRWKGAFEKAGFDYKPHLNFHVDTTSAEVVEANLGKSRKRDIRMTIREGVTIKEISNLGFQISNLERERLVREYYAILEKLYKTKVKTPLFPVEFFLALSQQKDARFLLTELNGKVIGGTVCVILPGKCMYEWFACGEDGVYPHVFPSCYATYAGIQYAAEHNCPRFDMMGAGKPDEAYGVRDFKAKFGGKEVEHGRFICVAKPLLYRIGKLGVKMLKAFR